MRIGMLSRLHSLNASIYLLCCITNVESKIFMSNFANIWTILALFNAMFYVEHVDFYTNVCYSILSTFEEGGICIGKS